MMKVFFVSFIDHSGLLNNYFIFRNKLHRSRQHLKHWSIILSRRRRRRRREINWSQYNESLVRRGEMLFDDGFLQNWRAELKKMNKGKKEGANYRYPNSLILLLATLYMRTYFHTVN